MMNAFQPEGNVKKVMGQKMKFMTTDDSIC